MSKFSTESGWLVCSNTADIVHVQKDVDVGGEEENLLLNNSVDIVRDSLPTRPHVLPLLNSTDRSSPPPVSPPPKSPPPARTPSPYPRVTPETKAYPPPRVSIRTRQRKLTPPPPPLQLSVSRNRRATDVVLLTTPTPRKMSSICESSSPSSPSSSSLPYKRVSCKRFPLVQSTAPLPRIVDVHVTSSQREPSSLPPPTGQLMSTNMYTRANGFTILPTIIERRSSCSSLDLTKQSTLDQTQTHFCSSNSTMWIWNNGIVSTVVVAMLAIFVHVCNLAGYDTATPIN